MGRKWITLSFDDGTIHDIRMIELLDRYQIKCTFNLNSARLGDKHRYATGGLDCDHSEVEPQQVATVYRNHEVAGHGCNHNTFLHLHGEALRHEAEDDRAALSRLWGKEVIGCAYPNGPYDDRVVQELKALTQLRYVRTTRSSYGFSLPADFMEWHPTCAFEYPGLSRLAERFFSEETEEDRIFYIYGHSYNFDLYHNWDQLEQFCRLIAFRKDCIYATNADIYHYYHQT